MARSAIAQGIGNLALLFEPLHFAKKHGYGNAEGNYAEDKHLQQLRVRYSKYAPIGTKGLQCGHSGKVEANGSPYTPSSGAQNT